MNFLCKAIENKKKGSGSFPLIRSRPAARSDFHGALSQCFDFPTESFAAPWFLLLRMQAQRIDAVCVHAGEQAAICVEPCGVIRSQREVGSVRSDAGLVCAVRVAGMAGPPVLPGGRHDARANGIELDVSIAGKGVVFAVHQGRLEPPFPQCARVPVACVEIADIPTSDGLHHARDATGFARRHQQMYMIGHQCVGMQYAVVPKCGLAHCLPVANIIGGVGKARLPVVAALDDMLGNAWEIKAGQACHV